MLCVPADSAPVVMVSAEPFIEAAFGTSVPSILTAILAARAGYLPFSIVAVPVSVADAPALTVAPVLFSLTDGASVFVTAWCAVSTIWSSDSAELEAPAPFLVNRSAVNCAAPSGTEAVSCAQLLPVAAESGAVSSLPSASVNTAVSVPAVFSEHAHRVR